MRGPWLWGFFLVPGLLYASPAFSPEQDPIASTLFWVTLIFSLALLGRFIARFFNQPGVLGELIMGIVFGNLCYFFGQQMVVVLREGGVIFAIMRDLLTNNSLVSAIHTSISNPKYALQVQQALSSETGIDYIKVAYVLDAFSRYGVIFLLFMVGLESSLKELKHTGREAMQVAIIGVLAPIGLGFMVAYCLNHASNSSNLFVAATLSATSIGITAKVLSEMKILRTREARTILGAAMIDDVLGLILLAVVSSMVISGTPDWFMVAQVIAATGLFFTGSIILGPWVLQQLIGRTSFLEVKEAKLFIAFIFVMGLAWLATAIGLSSIIGAFVAGMILDDQYFHASAVPGKHHPSIKDVLTSFEALLAPLFFMLIGIQVKLEAFFDWRVIWVSGILTLAAIIGKLVSGVGASRRDDRLFIGIGMLPRGEVGLVFASIGRTLGVINDQLFSAIILMVIITTVLAPPLLKIRYARTH